MASRKIVAGASIVAPEVNRIQRLELGEFATIRTGTSPDGLVESTVGLRLASFLRQK